MNPVGDPLESDYRRGAQQDLVKTLPFGESLVTWGLIFPSPPPLPLGTSTGSVCFCCLVKGVHVPVLLGCLQYQAPG